MRRIVFFLMAVCLALPALAEARYQSSPERREAPAKDWGPWAGPWRAKIISMMGVDFGEQYLYAPANAALPPPADKERRVVFFGDSITDLWDLAKFFPGKPYINRGIGGQVTPQMVVRFNADVAALHPKAVVILGGINDVGGALQVETPEQIEANWRTLAQLAEANGIKPIFTLLLPMNNYTENARHMLEERDPKVVDVLNRWLTAFSAEHHYGLIDYGPVLRDAKGLMAANFTSDGLHPNDDAYALMAPIAEREILQAVGAEDYDSQKVEPLPANGLAMTPPMGWNSWNKFACNVNEKLVRGAADSMIASGMKDAGYHYVLIDDCWQGERDKAGNIQADPQKFPSGIKALADYVHAKGLLLGIYSDAGTMTCGKRPGSRGHEYQDAKQYAAWGVDYLKYDWCFTGTQDGPASYRTMADALRETGRPIVFSACEWGTNRPWHWGAAQGANLWRATGDISDMWQGRKEYQLGVVDIVDLVEPLAQYAGPGHWNDPDMLEVGNGGMTETEYRSHFTLWAELAAPLIAGNDLEAMPPAIKAILTNREVIAVDQDSLGQQGRRVWREGDLEVWSKTLADGGRAVVLFNRGGKAASITARWSDLGLAAGQSAKVRDLWKGRDLPKATDKVTATVESHGVVMLKVNS
jgi:alpha-galactosidase